MCKLKLEVFASQDKSRLDLSVFVCLQKKIVGKLSIFIRKKKSQSFSTDRPRVHCDTNQGQ